MAAGPCGGMLHLVVGRPARVPRIMLVMPGVMRDKAPGPVQGLPLGLIPAGWIPDMLLERVPLLGPGLVPTLRLIPRVVSGLSPEMMPSLMPHMVPGLIPGIVRGPIAEVVPGLIPAILPLLMLMPCQGRLRQHAGSERGKGRIAQDRFHCAPPSPFCLGARGRFRSTPFPRQPGAKQQTQRRGGWATAPGCPRVAASRARYRCTKATVAAKMHPPTTFSPANRSPQGGAYAQHPDVQPRQSRQADRAVL